MGRRVPSSYCSYLICKPFIKTISCFTSWCFLNYEESSLACGMPDICTSIVTSGMSAVIGHRWRGMGTLMFDLDCHMVEKIVTCSTGIYISLEKLGTYGNGQYSSGVARLSALGIYCKF